MAKAKHSDPAPEASTDSDASQSADFDTAATAVAPAEGADTAATTSVTPNRGLIGKKRRLTADVGDLKAGTEVSVVAQDGDERAVQTAGSDATTLVHFIFLESVADAGSAEEPQAERPASRSRGAKAEDLESSDAKA